MTVFAAALGIRQSVAALALLAGLVSPADAAGFQWESAPDPRDSPLAVAIWYPSDAATSLHRIGPFHQRVALDGALEAKALPLIVLSHGWKGSAASSYGMAIALADAGFVVAAVTHTRDNDKNQDDSFLPSNLKNRPRHISRVIDFMLSRWRDHRAIDPTRIGVFGHSLGATTALVTIGGKIDFRPVVAFCQANPANWMCQAGRHSGQSMKDLSGTDLIVSGLDSRIKAAVLAAPALAGLFRPDGLSGISVPVQTWVAAGDQVVPNGDIVRTLLPAPTDSHDVDHAGHFAFLGPCDATPASAAIDICDDPPGFDRASFLPQFESLVIGFFKKNLDNVAGANNSILDPERPPG